MEMQLVNINNGIMKIETIDELFNAIEKGQNETVLLIIITGLLALIASFLISYFKEKR